MCSIDPWHVVTSGHSNHSDFCFPLCLSLSCTPMTSQLPGNLMSKTESLSAQRGRPTTLHLHVLCLSVMHSQHVHIDLPFVPFPLVTSVNMRSLLQHAAGCFRM